MKNLKPKSTEPHEIIIKLFEEVEYLVKRLGKLKVSNILDTDTEYLNTVYHHLLQDHQLPQNEWDREDYESKQEAFVDFLSEKYQTALKKRMRMESLKEIKTENKEKTTIKCFAYNEICQTSKFGPKKKEDKNVGPKVTTNKASISTQETKECPC